MNGGEGGIRTHGTLARSPVFKTMPKYCIKNYDTT